MKLLLDELCPATLAEELRRRGHDVVAVAERPDLAHRADDVIFDHAATEGRVVFTENVPDFVPLATGVLSTGGTFPGLLLTSNAAWPRGNPRTLGRGRPRAGRVPGRTPVRHRTPGPYRVAHRDVS